jgi:hypothetical protein
MIIPSAIYFILVVNFSVLLNYHQCMSCHIDFLPATLVINWHVICKADYVPWNTSLCSVIKKICGKFLKEQLLNYVHSTNFTKLLRFKVCWLSVQLFSFKNTRGTFLNLNKFREFCNIYNEPPLRLMISGNIIQLLSIAPNDSKSQNTTILSAWNFFGQLDWWL